MIFTDQDKKRGRLTAPERQTFAVEADNLGISLAQEISEGQALALVLQKMKDQSPANAAIVDSIFANTNMQPPPK